MSNITYLLGAGASANALPLVADIPVRLKIMGTYIQSYKDSTETSKYRKDLDELSEELSDYNTIDNYARVLFQNKTVENDLKLRKLKSLLCGLFMFEQLKKKEPIINPFTDLRKQDVDSIKRTIDPRYKSFFAKVLHNNKLNDQISIISWNYDLQIEIGIENNLGLSYAELNPSFDIFPHPAAKVKTNDFDIFSDFFGKTPKVIKLNGTAGIFLNEDQFSNIYQSQNLTFDEEYDILLNVHKEVSRYHKYNPFIKFAWEKDAQTQKAINYAKAIIDKTNLLVIIGYSFPDFNRNIDKQIFEGNNISEIFVQIPSDSFETVRYNMSTSFGRKANDCINIKNLYEFFIPSRFVPEY